MRNLSFQISYRQTAAVGLDEMSNDASDVDRNRGEGEISPSQTCARWPRPAGVSLPILDPNGEAGRRIWRSGISDPGFMEFLGYSADDFFRIADELGVSTMTVIGTLCQPGLASVLCREIAELASFSLLADQGCRAHGLFLRWHSWVYPYLGNQQISVRWRVSRYPANRPTAPTPRWHSISGTTSAAVATTPCCGLFRETGLPMCRSRTQKLNCRLGGRWKKIVCSIACNPARALCRSKKCSTFFAISAGQRE